MNNRDFTDRAVDWLKGVNRFTRAIESLLIDMIAGIAPWMAPLVPAIMVYHGMISFLKFEMWTAVATAVVIETLGLAGVTTAFQFFDYNDARGKSEQRAPVLIAVLAAVFYLVVVLSVNVLMDQKASKAEQWAKALLSSLSICAGVILALRSQHARRLERNIDVKAERKSTRHGTQPEPFGNFPESFGKLPKISDWRRLPKDDQELIISTRMTWRDIQSKYDVPERTARNWSYKADENGNRNS